MINAFLELGLPYILRFIDDWRAGRATIKDALHGKANHATGEDVKRAEDADEAEKRFLEKVEFELSLPEYTTFSTSHLPLLHSLALSDSFQTRCSMMLRRQPTMPKW